MSKVLVLALGICSFSGVAQPGDLLQAKLAVDSLKSADKGQALVLAEETLPLAQAQKDTFYTAYFLDIAGELNRLAGNYDRAIKQLNLCLTYKANWEDLKDLSITHNNLGRTYGQKGTYELAIYHFLEALKLMETAGNLLGQSFYLNNLAAMYDLQHNYPKAIEYYEQSLRIKEQLGNENGKAATLVNLGISYFNLGDLDKSLRYHERALAIYQTQNLPDKLARTINNMGEIFIQKEDYRRAQAHISEAYALDTLLTDEKLRMTIGNNLAKVLFLTGNLKEAAVASARVEAMAKASNSFALLKDVYALRAQMEEQAGNLKSAIDYLNVSVAYNDSLINEANIYAVADMQAKYEYEKNLRVISEKELAIARQEKLVEQEKLKVVYWLGISIFLIVVVCVLVVLYMLNQKNARLLKGQMVLIDKQNRELTHLNKSFKSQLDKTQMTLEEKEELLEVVFTKSREKELPAQLLALSKREMEVLSYLALGWSDEQLAERLFVSKATVKTHLRRIYSKLLVRGRAEAVTIAHKHDLLGAINLAS